MKPLCFVLMPFGKKKDAAGTEIDFDSVYRGMIAPAIEKAGLEPLRADQETLGGIIHQAMFERLILCDYAVADLTTANANVFYELGVRHGIRPGTTVCCFATGTNLPFDLRMQRAVPYDLTGEGVPKDPTKAGGPIDGISKLLIASRDGVFDSPVFALVRDMKPPEIKHLKTDTFREQVSYDRTMKERIASARALPADQAKAELSRIEGELVAAVRDLKLAPAGVVVDLFLSRRAISDWAGMIALHEKMHESLQRSVMVREQLAFAYNRNKQPDKAQAILEDLIATNGPSSETYGLLGRIHKDRWDAARRDGRRREAEGYLDRAIEAYQRGFEADMRDAFPGINALTLMEFVDDEQVRARQASLIPVVRYAVERKIAGKPADYWDRATQLELAALSDDRKGADRFLGQTLALVREAWEPETTARNLSLITEARKAAGRDVGWLGEIASELSRKADEIRAGGKR